MTSAITATGFAFLQQQFAQLADQPFVTVCEGGPQLSYGQFWQRAQAQADRLAELGMRADDRLLIRLENGLDHLQLYLACAIGGFVACPVDNSLPEARLAAIRRQVEPRYEVEAGNAAQWSAPSDGSARALRPTDHEPDFLVIMSSGTTGSPKGIVHTVQSLVQSARSFAALAGHDRTTVVYHHFPMFYMAGVFNLFLCPAVAGSRIVIGPRFSGAQMVRFWELPRAHGVNHLTLTPTMALSLARMYRTDPGLLDYLSHFNGVISTGSALVPAVAERFEATFGVPLLSCYGVTEVGGSITLQHWEDALAAESVGQWQSEVQLQAGARAETPAELLVRTPFMMRGYLANGKVTTPFDEQGYFHTGDLGYLQAGRLFITGRENDFVKKGGEFVPLLMVEDLALREPGVQEAAVVAVPDDFWGNRIVLFYVPQPDQELDEIEAALSVRFDAQLRKIEQPDKMIAVPRLPKTAIGKTVKRELVRRYTL